MSYETVPPEWLDKFGQVKAFKHEKGIGPNNLLFTVQRKFLERNAYGTKLPKKHDLILSRRIKNSPLGEHKGLYKQTQTAPDSDPCSHDDMTAMVSYQFAYEKQEGRSTGFFEDFRILGRYWHPRDLLVYNWAKGGWRRWVARIFLLLLIPIDIYSVLVNGGKPYLDTDGDLLIWVRSQGFKDHSWVMWLSWKICTWLVHTKLLKWSVSCWKDMFRYYFKPKDHPNNYFHKEIYEL